MVILILKSRDIGSDSCGGGFYTELNWGLGTLADSRNVSFKIPFYIRGAVHTESVCPFDVIKYVIPGFQ